MLFDTVSSSSAAPVVSSADTSSMGSSSGGEIAIALALGLLSLTHPWVILQAALPTSHLASSVASVAEGNIMAAIMGKNRAKLLLLQPPSHSHA
jgi:hypothetical protein